VEPRIQYTTTSDGVRIAFSTVGEGITIVLINNLPWSNIREEWNWPAYRRTYEWLLQGGGRRLVLYDHRGCGLSQRDVSDLSLSAYVLDLEVVADQLALPHFVLIGAGHGAVVAAAYAADHPDRVSHLVLYPAYVRAADVYATPAGQALRALRNQDWTIYSESMARILAGFVGGEEELSRAAAYYRSCVSQEGCLLAHQAIEQFDLTDVLPRICVPTLVLYRSGTTLPTLEMTEAATAAIPGAELVIFEQVASSTWFEQESALVARFVGLEDEGAYRAELTSRFRAVLFTDIVGHTEMMSRLGDERGRAVLREHERITRDVLKAHGGTEVKTMGDGFMASFGSVTKAVECAVALQRAFAKREGEPLSVRVGLNAGEPIEEDGDLFGATVILASRIAAKAEGGEILVAETVRGLCSGKGFLFADRGEFVAKGFEEPVRVYEVRWRE
jgi:class 3 adenylate cyclase